MAKKGKRRDPVYTDSSRQEGFIVIGGLISLACIIAAGITSCIYVTVVETGVHAQPPTQPTAAVTPVQNPTFSTLPKLGWPFSGKITQFYGDGQAGITIESSSQKKGLPDRQPVVASADGIVVYVGKGLSSNYGADNYSFPTALHVTILHSNGIATVYGNLGSTAVKNGQEVKEGDMLGEATELFFGISVAGVYENPLHYLDGGKYE